MSPTGGRGIVPSEGTGLFAAFGGGRTAAGRQPGTRPSRGAGQKGVQDTCGFLYPLLRHPLIFRRPRKRCFAAKNEESTDFTSVLSFFFCHGSAIAWFAAHISARQRVQGG